MNYKLRELTTSLFALSLFIVALFFLHRLLSEYHFGEIREALHAIPPSRILLSFCFTALSYFCLTFYDTLAFIHIGKSLSYKKVALASFISYSFANNTGSLSIITASSIRYRFYSGWGFSSLEIARIVWFCMASFWLGFLFLTGAGLLAAPPSHIFSFPLAQTTVFCYVGVLFLLVVGGYLAVSALVCKPVRFLRWDVAFPAPRLAMGQVAVAATDLLFAAAALYVLMPEISVPFASVVTLFLISMILGLVSNVPGGLGVFESVMLVMLTPYARGIELISSLLLFRCIYYLLPLTVSVVVLGGLEVYRRLGMIARISASIQKIMSVFIPQVLALATLVAGAILLFSGTIPPLAARLSWLSYFLPLPILEVSHFLGSVVGMSLLILAAGLRRRLDMAYYLTILMLVLGILFSLLKGLDYEEASWLSILLVALSVSRNQFFRKTSILIEPIKISWLATLLIIFCGSVGLGLFVYRHQTYSNDLWWQFALHGDAPRFMRASVGAAVLALCYATARLFRPYHPIFATPGWEDVARAARIASASPDTSGYLALLGDKSLLFSESGSTFIMYGVKGKSWIAMGDPIGEREEAADLIWKFKNSAEQFGCWPVFHEVDAGNLSWYIDMGMTVLKIGEEGRVNLAEFTLEGSRNKGFRNVCNRFRKNGYRFEVLPPDEIPGVLPEFKNISDQWLADKKTGEKGFSLGFFNEHYLCSFPVAVVRFQGKILAFVNLWCGGDKTELSVDLMRYLAAAPNGIMDYLFCEIMLWGREQGYNWFNLGMVPLAGLESAKVSSLWGNIGTFVYRHGEYFYNFSGLRNYKNKFAPVWRPKYLVFPGGIQLPSVLASLTSLIGSNFKKVISR
ncbi:bifunctional lysylphosphatidylglycerol flippase/synthetase MprF [Desulforhopalus singaporensis]|uniref:Phosphatidylglycerol lysyltransferase n=1 Tax=Desulforhopalus singaporensis TaxID=91360 RepID=A0A1H0SJ47_9BACT|nr:bifunctional lysylphosphatidylglycerol flippase/synthetase MprF [Desulforhopalus singaporensis]SDP41740.1 phosphatidylglycerol lysyltransferase [Desulforhopalus singaporensis]